VVSLGPVQALYTGSPRWSRCQWCGVQLGLGLQLAMKGASLVWFMPAAPKGPHLSPSSPLPLPSLLPSPLPFFPPLPVDSQGPLSAPCPSALAGRWEDSLALALEAAALVLLVSGAAPGALFQPQCGLRITRGAPG